MSEIITGVHHISFKTLGVEEFYKTVDFYTSLLGMKVVHSWGSGERLGVMIDTGNCYLEISSDAKEHKDAGLIAHFALKCSDPDNMIEKMQNAGYTVTLAPRDHHFPESDPGYDARICFIIGPCGETIEFFKEY